MTKPKPSLKSNDKEGFLRAATDEWKDIESTYEVTLEFVLEPAGRKGVFRLSVVALDPGLGHTVLTKAHYQCEFPTAAVESLEACIFRCCIRLEKILRDRYAYPSGKA